MLFAFAFTDVWMLGWLAAAAAPIIIHLWNKRKHREIEWAAMEYLLAAIRKNSRRIRIEQWLLLAIRTAIVVLAVLAVAGPYVQNFAGTFISGAPTHKVLVIDGSYSMDYKFGEQSRFDRAKQLAVQIVEQSSAADGFTLIRMGAPPTAILESPVSLHDTIIEEIENLKLRHAGADLAATFALVEETARRAAAEHPQYTHTQVYFLTDLGASTWNAAANAGAEQLTKSAELHIINVDQTESKNVAVTSLRCIEPYATANQPLHFEAQVTNYSREPRRQAVQWWIDGERVHEEAVELAAGRQQAVGLEWKFDWPGNYAIEVRAPGDALEIDNHRWLSIDVQQRINVLLVSGDGSQQAARQLVAALNPESDPAESPIHVEVAPESALVDHNLEAYDAVFLSNIGQFTPTEAQILSRYVNGGGGLVIFLGDRVQPQRYNQELGGGREGGLRLLPAQIEQPTEVGQFTVDPLDYRHTIIAEFAGNERAGLLTTPISKYFRLKLSANDSASTNVVVAIRETGDPLIVEEAIGEGRVVLLALPSSLATVDPATRNPWTLMPAWHSFLPLVQETLAYVLRNKAEQHNANVGDAIGSEGAAANESVTITLPAQGGEADSMRLTADNSGHWDFDDTWQSGIYRAKTATKSDAIPLAVNIETGDRQTGESSLQNADAADLPSEFSVLNAGQSASGHASIDLSVQTGIQQWFLYAVLLLLLIETGYAGWLGRRAGG